MYIWGEGWGGDLFNEIKIPVQELRSQRGEWAYFQEDVHNLIVCLAME